jgi:hypothetical protein
MLRLIGTIANIVGSFQTNSAPEMKKISIRAVLFQADGSWCAQCLEHDIAAEAVTLEDLKSELEQVLSVQAELSLERGQDPYSAIPRAPAKYFAMYEALERANSVDDAHPISLDADVSACIMARFAYQHAHVN